MFPSRLNYSLKHATPETITGGPRFSPHCNTCKTRVRPAAPKPGPQTRKVKEQKATMRASCRGTYSTKNNSCSPFRQNAALWRSLALIGDVEVVARSPMVLEH